MVSKNLLSLLVCPSCKGEVYRQGECIICRNSLCGLQYPIRDGIPIMLIDEAKKRHVEAE